MDNPIDRFSVASPVYITRFSVLFITEMDKINPPDSRTRIPTRFMHYMRRIPPAPPQWVPRTNPTALGSPPSQCHVCVTIFIFLSQLAKKIFRLPSFVLDPSICLSLNYLLLVGCMNLWWVRRRCSDGFLVNPIWMRTRSIHSQLPLWAPSSRLHFSVHFIFYYFF